MSSPTNPLKQLGSPFFIARMGFLLSKMCGPSTITKINLRRMNWTYLTLQKTLPGYKNAETSAKLRGKVDQWIFQVPVKGGR